MFARQRPTITAASQPSTTMASLGCSEMTIKAAVAASLASSLVLLHGVHLLPSHSDLPQAVGTSQVPGRSSPLPSTTTKSSSFPNPPELTSEDTDRLRMGNIFSKGKKRSKVDPREKATSAYYPHRNMQSREHQGNAHGVVSHFRLTEVVCTYCAARHKYCSYAGELQSRLLHYTIASTHRSAATGTSQSVNSRNELDSLPEWKLEIDLCGYLLGSRAEHFSKVLEGHLKPLDPYYPDRDRERRGWKPQRFSLPDLLDDLRKEGAQFRCVSKSRDLLEFVEQCRRVHESASSRGNNSRTVVRGPVPAGRYGQVPR
ncbi:hypothetical protein VTH82DRAFT_1741 [Thermothelomyces myriococcoides]